MEEVRENILGYSGDTPVENFDIWDNTRILIHEATFLSKVEIEDNDTRRNKHSVLEEVIRAAVSIDIKVLILGHFSSRYTNEEIEGIISCCQRYNATFPVYRMLLEMYTYSITATKL
jgi:ribonuclease Z